MRIARRPIIGITTQTLHAIDGIPPALPESWVMNQRYIRAVTSLGAVPWLVPLLDDDQITMRGVYERLDGILFPGGVDMDPSTFGAERHPLCGRIDPARDAVELQLTRWGLEDAKPLLGLCRGIQIFNVALGGTLYQDVGAERVGSIKHDYFPSQGFARDHLAHDVIVEAGTRTESALGSPRVAVNSMHHQAIRELAAGLVATAHAPDGVIEAVESSSDHWMVGVQWHPESLEGRDERAADLFRDFVAAAAKYGAAHEANR